LRAVDGGINLPEAVNVGVYHRNENSCFFFFEGRNLQIEENAGKEKQP
jgi:hypothetical protein